MRIASVLVLLALACASQAQLQNLLGSSKDSIENLVENAKGTINQAQETLNTGLSQGLGKLSELLESLQAVAKNTQEKAKEVIENIEKNTEDQINKLTGEAEGQGVDVSECKQLGITLRDTAKTVLTDALSCVTNKVTEGKTIVTNVINIGTESVKEITGIKGKIEDCVKDANSITAKIGAAACLTSAGTKSALALTSKVPAVIKNVAEATKLITTLQASLTTCASTNAIGALAKKSTTVIGDVKDCIAERVSGKNNQEEQKPTEEKTATEEKKEDATGPVSGMLGWLKGKIF